MTQNNNHKNLLPRKFYKLTAQMIYIVILPVFFLLFVLGYRPEGFVNLLDMGENRFTFNLTIVFAIIFGTILVMRLSLYFLRHKISHHPLWYMAWCIGEIFVMSFFVTLYIWLVYDSASMPYYEALSRTLGYCLSVLFYPYIVIFLLQLVESRAKLNMRSMSFGKNDTARIKFTDENGTIRLTANVSDILYLESDGNYVKINYISKNEKRVFSLRNSMKNIEPLCEQYKLARCHRSYILNPERVKLLSKDTDGTLFAELDNVASTRIPITKTYYDSISALL